jgi:ribosome-associated translation inhibitor RaiA
MITPLRVTFRHMKKSAAVEEKVREYLDHLQRLNEHITSCDVVVTAPPGHRHKGASFDVRVNVSVPHGSLHARSERATDEAHADVYLALRDAFDVVIRMLKEREQKLDDRKRRLNRSRESLEQSS